MAEINNSGSGQWSETDASNTSAVPDGWPSNMAPNNVRSTEQAMMGAIKRFWDRINGTVTTTGTAPHYVYTPTNTSYPTAYVTGEIYTFRAHAQGAGSDDLNINGLGAKLMYKPSTSGPTTLAAADIQANQMMMVCYDSNLNSSAGGFHVLAGIANASGGTLDGGTF